MSVLYGGRHRWQERRVFSIRFACLLPAPSPLHAYLPLELRRSDLLLLQTRTALLFHPVIETSCHPGAFALPNLRVFHLTRPPATIYCFRHNFLLIPVPFLCFAIHHDHPTDPAAPGRHGLVHGLVQHEASVGSPSASVLLQPVASPFPARPRAPCELPLPGQVLVAHRLPARSRVRPVHGQRRDRRALHLRGRRRQAVVVPERPVPAEPQPRFPGRAVVGDAGGEGEVREVRAAAVGGGRGGDAAEEAQEAAVAAHESRFVRVSLFFCSLC